MFYGYPEGNYLKQICVIMQLWNQSGRFPINFLEIESLKDYDESEHYI